MKFVVKGVATFIMGNSNRKPVECIPEMQRLSYDLSSLEDLRVPYIWLVGASGCGRDNQAEIMEQNYGFDVIKISELLEQHASNDTDRGRVIKENVNNREGYIPDTIILDLLKEAMLAKAKVTNGFVFNGFPRNRVQAQMFIKEIGNVDVIIILKCAMSVIADKLKVTHPFLSRADIKQKIRRYNRNLKRTLVKFGAKVEKFDSTKETPDEIFPRIQSALNVRIFGETGTRNATE